MVSIWDLELRVDRLRREIAEAERATDDLPRLKEELARTEAELQKRQDEDDYFRRPGTMADVAQAEG